MSEFDSISDSVTDDAFAAALDESTQDVVAVANEPVSSDETVVVAPEADPEVVPKADESSKEPKGEKPDETVEEPPKVEPSPEPEKQFNWDSAPESFREEYNTRKKELLELRQNSLQEKFLTDPDKFLDELSGLSTSQYQQTTQQIVKRGIDAMPSEFAEYLAAVAPDAVAKTLSELSPDMLAQVLFGDGMSAQKAQKIIAQVKQQDLEEFLNDGEEEVETPVPAKKTETAKAMTPDEIDKLVSQRVAEADKPKQVERLQQSTYAEIMKPVESLLKEANLTPSPSDPPEEREWKEFVSQQIIKDTFDFLMDGETNQPRAKKMLEMIESLDTNGVKHLASTAAILAEEHAGKRIQMLTSQRAKTRAAGTEPKKAPPRTVPSSGSVPSFGNPDANGGGRIAEISDSEFERAGM